MVTKRLSAAGLFKYLFLPPGIIGLKSVNIRSDILATICDTLLRFAFSFENYVSFKFVLLQFLPYFFFLSIPSFPLSRFIQFHQTLARFSVKPSLNLFVFEDFNVYHKSRLTYFGGTDRPGEPCYNFVGCNLESTCQWW